MKATIKSLLKTIKTEKEKAMLLPNKIDRANSDYPFSIVVSSNFFRELEEEKLIYKDDVYDYWEWCYTDYYLIYNDDGQEEHILIDMDSICKEEQDFVLLYLRRLEVQDED